MADPKALPARSTAYSTRFNDSPLSFGMRLFECGNPKSSYDTYRCIWRFEVKRYTSGEPLIEMDATKDAIREMRNFLARAEEMIDAQNAYVASFNTQADKDAA